MPLYKKKPFERLEAPANLKPTDKVYYLAASGEVFNSYDEFFNRMIVLNSTDFSCSLTGRTGLTYFEAIAAEREAKEELLSFPDYLEAPILFIVQNLTCRGRLDDVLSDVASFMKDRYFIGEELQWHDGRRKRAARVQAVRLADEGAWTAARLNGDHNSLVDCGLPPAEEYRYDIQLMDEDEDDIGNDDDDEDDGIREGARPSDLARNRANMSKQKLKLFLKNTCVLIDKRQEVKESYRKDCMLDQQSWLKFFSGPEPIFPQTPLICRGRPVKTPTRPEKEEKPKSTRKRKEGGVDKTSGVDGEGPKKRGRRSGAGDVSNSPRKMSEKKRKEIEAQQQELEGQIETAKRLGVEDMSRFEQYERILTPKDIELLKELIKQARIKDREETKERKKREKLAEIEWKKPRDDLLCDDLKPLPSYRPLPLPEWMTGDDLAEYLSLYQFFLSYQELLPIKDFFPGPRISFSDIVSAIRCRDPNFSTLASILRILWTARQERAEEEDGDEANLRRAEEIGGQQTTTDLDHPIHGDNIRTRNELHESVRETHGMSVRNLPIDWFTATEVIRLHLLTSGYFTGVSTSRHRTFQRGGIKFYEDAAYQFCEKYPDVLEQLETETIFDLMPSHRLALLQMLVDQLLSYQKFRQYHDDRTSDLHEHKKQLKTLRNWIHSQEKDAREIQLAREHELEKIEEEGESARMERPKASSETKRLRNHLKALKESRRTDLDNLEQLVLAGIAYNELELDEIVHAREIQKEKYEHVEKELMETIYTYQGVCSFIHLGRDRVYRSYFFLDAIPALIVEESSDWDRERAGPCDEATPISDQAVLDKYGNVQSCRLALLGCTADEYCPAHGNLAKERPRWSYIDEPDKIEELLSACNARGLRESELAEEVAFYKEKLEEMVERSARKTESGHLSSFFMKDEVDPSDRECSLMWEKECIELLLDMEEKIFIGQIGSLPPSIDRIEWRKRLSTTGDITGLIQGSFPIRVEGQLKMEEESGEGEQEILYFEEDFLTLSRSEKLAVALLQLFQAINFKYFKEPFVTKNRHGERQIAEVFLCWQRKLSESAKSVPAVALYLYTLESRILWSMSKLQGKCRTCRKKGEADQLVLCTDCCSTFHLYCVRPKLDKSIPDWACTECMAVRKREAAKEKRLAREAAQQRALEEVEEEIDEEGGFVPRQGTSMDRQTDHSSPIGKSEDGGDNVKVPVNAVKTSSGRVVKKVLYNENVYGTVVVTKGKKPTESASRTDRENSWDDYDSTDSSTVDTPKRGDRNKKRKTNEFDSSNRVSIGLRESSGSLKESLHECELAIKDTMGQYFSWPFTAPVDKREVPDYYDVIKQPMDLQTMITKIKNNKYDSLDEVQSDLDLMVSNCKFYNEDGSDIVELAIQTSEHLQPLLDRIMRNAKRWINQY